MESKKILIVSFLSVTSILLSGCHSQNLSNGFGHIGETFQTQCTCEWNADTTRVHDILNQFEKPTDVDKNYKRQIIYLYKDLLNNVTIIHIPNGQKQKLIPDAPIEKNDVLVKLTNETVNDLFSKNPKHVTLENASPRPKATGMDKIVNVPEKDTIQIELKKPNYINSDIHKPVEIFKPIDPIDINRPETSYSDNTNTLEVPINFSKGFWPGSHVSAPDPHHLYPSDIKPLDSAEQEPVMPITFNEDFWPGSHVSAPHPQHLNPSYIKPLDSAEQEPVMPINFNEDFWPGSHVSAPHPQHLNPSDIKPLDSAEQEPVMPINFNEDFWPGSHVSAPHPQHLNPSDIKPLDSAEQEPVMPITFNEDFWPGLHVSAPHPHNLNPSDIKPLDFAEQGPVMPINFNEDFWPGSHVSTPHLHLHNPSDIKPLDSAEQEPVVPITFNEDFWPGLHVSVPHPHNLNPSDIKPLDFAEQGPVMPINFNEDFWPGSHVSAPHPHTFNSTDVKPVYSGKQKPGHYLYGVPNPGEMKLNKPVTDFYKPGDSVMMIRPYYSLTKKPCYECKPTKYYKIKISPYFIRDQYPEPAQDVMVPHSNPLHPSAIKHFHSAEQQPEYSVDVPHLDALHPSDIKPVYSGKQEPVHSEEVHPSAIKQVNSGEPEPLCSVEVPDSNSPDPSDIKPDDSGKKEPDNSVEVPDLHPLHVSDIKPVHSDEQEPDPSVQSPESHSLYPSNIKELSSGEKEPDHSIEIPDSHPSDIKPVDSGEQKSGPSIEKPDPHPSNIKPVDSDENEPNYSLEVPNSHPSKIKPVDSDEQEPGSFVEESDSYSSNTKPVDSDENETNYSLDVPDSHPSDIKPVDSYENEPNYSLEVPDSHPSNIKAVDSDKNELNYYLDVPDSHPSDIKPVDSYENEPNYSLEVPDSHPSDIKAVNSDKNEPNYSLEVPDLHPSDIKPVGSDENETNYSLDVPDSHPIDIKPFESDENEPNYSLDVPDSHPSDIKPVDSGENEPDHSVQVPVSYSSDIKPVDSSKKDANYSLKVPDSHPTDIKPVDPGNQEPDHSVQVLYSVQTQRDEPKTDFDKHELAEPAIELLPEYPQIKKPCYKCKPPKYYKIQIPPYVIRNQYPGRFKWSIKSTTKDSPTVHYQKNPIIDSIHKYKKRKDPFGYMGYKTFYQWFREEMHRFKNNNQSVNVNFVGHLILKILYENGMFVTDGGVLKDPQGRILYLQNLKLQPILIGDSVGLDKLLKKDSNGRNDIDHAVSTWSEFVVLTMLYPPKTLGVIPLGTTYLPPSSALNSLSSIFKYRNDSKLRSKISKGRSPFHLLPQKVDSRYKRLQYSGNPLKITEPENRFSSKYQFNQNINTRVSKDGAVKDDNGHDESVENFLRNMPHYSHRRKGYVDRHDLSRNDPLHLNDAIVESRKIRLNRKRSDVQHKHENRHKPQHARNHNDGSLDNDQLIRIIGGMAATGSGTALNNKGRSGAQQKLHNHRSHDHGSKHRGSHNPKKHYHDYINREDLYSDDSHVRIIGGNAATGSGSPLNSKGRSGASH